MSFHEKSSWVMLATMVLVYGWYYLAIAGELGGDVSTIDYQGLMLVTVLVVVAVIAVSHIVIASIDPNGADQSDERDKTINRYGEYIGGFALVTGTLVGLGLAMAEFEQFWIANALLLGLILSEVTSGATKIILYRRGF